MEIACSQDELDLFRVTFRPNKENEVHENKSPSTYSNYSYRRYSWGVSTAGVTSGGERSGSANGVESRANARRKGRIARLVASINETRTREKEGDKSNASDMAISEDEGLARPVSTVRSMPDRGVLVSSVNETSAAREREERNIRAAVTPVVEYREAQGVRIRERREGRRLDEGLRCNQATTQTRPVPQPKFNNNRVIPRQLERGAPLRWPLTQNQRQKQREAERRRKRRGEKAELARLRQCEKELTVLRASQAMGRSEPGGSRDQHIRDDQAGNIPARVSILRRARYEQEQQEDQEEDQHVVPDAPESLVVKEEPQTPRSSQLLSDAINRPTNEGQSCVALQRIEEVDGKFQLEVVIDLKQVLLGESQYEHDTEDLLTITRVATALENSAEYRISLSGERLSRSRRDQEGISGRNGTENLIFGPEHQNKLQHQANPDNWLCLCRVKAQLCGGHVQALFMFKRLLPNHILTRHLIEISLSPQLLVLDFYHSPEIQKVVLKVSAVYSMYHRPTLATASGQPHHTSGHAHDRGFSAEVDDMTYHNSSRLTSSQSLQILDGEGHGTTLDVEMNVAQPDDAMEEPDMTLTILTEDLENHENTETQQITPQGDSANQPGFGTGICRLASSLDMALATFGDDFGETASSEAKIGDKAGLLSKETKISLKRQREDDSDSGLERDDSRNPLELASDSSEIAQGTDTGPEPSIRLHKRLRGGS
ncbi:hypothetical protein NP233_g4826 [Leucocoprinus birnbaumii]|uniref:Uncharacterized protein n=1 Tax=Leucocoprinus birnbaumii TaxID=56174 RepID=A0AAD5VVD5_9AGAR|nr:hypothetical protein NP233_g4826 [Leucocoprinus birnbaumii]